MQATRTAFQTGSSSSAGARGRLGASVLTPRPPERSAMNTNSSPPHGRERPGRRQRRSQHDRGSRGSQSARRTRSAESEVSTGAWPTPCGFADTSPGKAALPLQDSNARGASPRLRRFRLGRWYRFGRGQRFRWRSRFGWGQRLRWRGRFRWWPGRVCEVWRLRADRESHARSMHGVAPGVHT